MGDIADYYLNDADDWIDEPPRSTPLNQKGVDLTRPHFILWNPTSGLPPTVRFKSLKEAQAAAMKMVNRFPKDTFCICEVVGKAATAETPVKVTMLKRGRK